MTTLYVIGNGFDLWHGLPTSYSHFYNFAKDVLDEAEKYYLLEGDSECLWSDFENALGTFSWDYFYDDYNYVDIREDDFRPSQVYGLEDELSEQGELHVESIKEKFRDWISEIDTSNVVQKVSLREGAQFINFNYTSTLQSVYGVDNDKILHIHGRAETYDDLVFGHAEEMEEVPELDENGDSNRSIFSAAEDAAKYPFYELKKQVDEVLEAHKAFFSSLDSIVDIIVIGHSLNKIDLPYFRELAGQSPHAYWTVCIRKCGERRRAIHALSACGVTKDRISFCTYRNL